MLLFFFLLAKYFFISSKSSDSRVTKNTEGWLADVYSAVKESCFSSVTVLSNDVFVCLTSFLTSYLEKCDHIETLATPPAFVPSKSSLLQENCFPPQPLKPWNSGSFLHLKPAALQKQLVSRSEKQKQTVSLHCPSQNHISGVFCVLVFAVTASRNMTFKCRVKTTHLNINVDFCGSQGSTSALRAALADFSSFCTI